MAAKNEFDRHVYRRHGAGGHERGRRAAAVVVAVLAALVTTVGLGSAPVAAAPVITATPATTSGSVQVSGTGLASQTRYWVRQCAPASAGCEYLATVRTSAAGAFTQAMTIRLDVLVTTPPTASLVDCQVVQCIIRVEEASEALAGTAPLNLAALPLRPGTLTASPSATDLVDSTELTLSAPGYAGTGALSIRQCALGRGEGATCPPSATAALPSVGTGSHAGPVKVRRDSVVGDFDPDVFDIVDCVEEQCALFVEARAEGTEVLRRSMLELGFRDDPRPSGPPTVTVAPTPGGAPHEYTATGAGFPYIDGIWLHVCASEGPKAVDPRYLWDKGYDCSRAQMGVEVDATGGFTAPVDVWRWPIGLVSGVDCLVHACTVHADLQDWIPLGVSDPVTITNGIAVAVASDGTLAASGHATVQATVTCQEETPIDVTGTITQGTTTATWTLDDWWCAEGETVTAFVRARPTTGAFTQGAATVTVTVDPALGEEGFPTETTGTATLYDEAAVASAIQTAMADPANEALRQAVIAAVIARAKQDPEFAAELYRAILAAGGF